MMHLQAPKRMPAEQPRHKSAGRERRRASNAGHGNCGEITPDSAVLLSLYSGQIR